MRSDRWELGLLKTLLWIYIILCLIIASLNWGYVPSASPQRAKIITEVWHFYENWIKTLLIIVCTLLTLRIVKKKKIRTTMRRRNLVGFAGAALLVHILLPILLKNPEVYFFAMPLPWSTVPLQAGVEGTAMHHNLASSIGMGGIRSSLLFFWIYSASIFGGTLLFGRRLQCSSLCLFNGFAAEVFGPAIPLVGHFKTPLSKKRLTLFALAQKAFFVLGLLFTLYWTLLWPLEVNQALIAKAETFKYLLFELLMAMFFWVAFVGRLYCYYCPLGTLLGWIAKLGGQRITTNKTHCIQCGKCTDACPLSIDVKAFAVKKEPVDLLRCVGCGHCIDVCPTKTLSYSTHYIRSLHRRRSSPSSKEV